MPVRHLLVWLAAGAACWSLIAIAALAAPETLLALGALLVLPWLRRPATAAAAVGAGGADPVLLPVVGDGVGGVQVRDEGRVLVA